MYRVYRVYATKQSMNVEDWKMLFPEATLRMGRCAPEQTARAVRLLNPGFLALLTLSCLQHVCESGPRPRDGTTWNRRDVDTFDAMMIQS